jgi:hypothetical protein
MQLAEFLSAPTAFVAAAFCHSLSPPELPAVRNVLLHSSSCTSQTHQPAPAPAEQVAAAQRTSKRAAALLSAQPSLVEAVVRVHPLCQQPGAQLADVLADVLAVLPEACHLAVCNTILAREQGRLVVAGMSLERFAVLAKAIRLLPQALALHSLALQDPTITAGKHDSLNTQRKLAPIFAWCSHLQAVRLHFSMAIIAEILLHLVGLSDCASCSSLLHFLKRSVVQHAEKGWRQGRRVRQAVQRRNKRRCALSWRASLSSRTCSSLARLGGFLA